MLALWDAMVCEFRRSMICGHPTEQYNRLSQIWTYSTQFDGAYSVGGGN